MKNLKKLSSQLDRIEMLIDRSEQINHKVSKASVGWHLHHILLTLNKVYTAISRSETSEYKRTVNAARSIILKTGIIPRKRAQSPKSVRPKPGFSKVDLNSELDRARENMRLFGGLEEASFFSHPYFGDLQLKQTIRFLVIHTKHHLKIIEDIIME